MRHVPAQHRPVRRIRVVELLLRDRDEVLHCPLNRCTTSAAWFGIVACHPATSLGRRSPASGSCASPLSGCSSDRTNHGRHEAGRQRGSRKPDGSLHVSLLASDRPSAPGVWRSSGNAPDLDDASIYPNLAVHRGVMYPNLVIYPASVQPEDLAVTDGASPGCVLVGRDPTGAGAPQRRRILNTPPL